MEIVVWNAFVDRQYIIVSVSEENANVIEAAVSARLGYACMVTWDYVQGWQYCQVNNQSDHTSCSLTAGAVK